MRAENLSGESSPSAWRLFWLVTLPVFVASFALAVCQPDTADLLCLFVAGPLLLVLSAALLVYVVKGKNRRISMLTLAVAWLVFLPFFVYQRQIRTAVRWSLWSHQYTTTLLAKQTSSEAELKHMEWDGWGWAGTDTTVYLVFDPTNSLPSAASRRLDGKFTGVPCEVAEVSRLESQWYAVMFYTNQDWEHCDPTDTTR